MPRFGAVAYETFGQLNAAADNCVLLPTYFAGTDKSYLPLIGAGRALDPARWFIVVVNMLGNGVSSSPSNDVGYAPASVADNVRLQHGLLSALGVRRIALVYGWSMGAMQGYAWAALFPDMVRSLLAVCGSARCWPLNSVFLDGLAAILKSAASPPEAGKRAFGRAYAGWAYAAAFYRDGLYRMMGYPTCEEFLQFWEDDHAACDASDLLAMLWTWRNATAGAAELGRITAKTIIMPCDTDMYFTLAEARIEAAMIPGAELRVLHSPYGHCAGAPGRFAAETAAVEQAMRDLLN